jgi:hypothetical protein
VLDVCGMVEVNRNRHGSISGADQKKEIVSEFRTQPSDRRETLPVETELQKGATAIRKGDGEEQDDHRTARALCGSDQAYDRLCVITQV